MAPVDVPVALGRGLVLRHLVARAVHPHLAHLRRLAEQQPARHREVGDRAGRDDPELARLAQEPRRRRGDGGERGVLGEPARDGLRHHGAKRLHVLQAVRREREAHAGLGKRGRVRGRRLPVAQLLRADLERVRVVGHVGRVGEVHRHHERVLRGRDLVRALVLVACGDDGRGHPGLGRDPGRLQHLEHLVGHHEHRLLPGNDRLERRPGEVLGHALGRGPLGGRRPRVAIPLGIQEHLAQDRDRAHQRARILVAAAGLERHHLRGVRANDAGVGARAPQPHHGARAAHHALARRHLGRGEAGRAQRLELRRVERQVLHHPVLRSHRGQLVHRSARGLGRRRARAPAAGRCAAAAGTRRRGGHHERIDQPRVHGEAVAFPHARVRRDRDVRAYGNDEPVTNHHGPTSDHAAGPRHDACVADGVHARRDGRGGRCEYRQARQRGGEVDHGARRSRARGARARGGMGRCSRATHERSPLEGQRFAQRRAHRACSESGHQRSPGAESMERERVGKVRSA